MSFDGFVTHSIVRELREKLLSGRIDKIYQPERDEIIVSVRALTGNYKLLLSAASSNPRIHLTELDYENPITAPLFCMILRKHLGGGKITAVNQHGFDRVVSLTVESYNEMGDLTEKQLIIEVMGRHSNIILMHENNKIIDSVKHIDFTVSAVRQILPGLIYENPPAQDKTEPSAATPQFFEEKLAALPDDTPLDKFLLSELVGMSPLMAREAVYRSMGSCRVMLSECNPHEFSKKAADFIAGVIDGSEQSCVVCDKDTKKPIAFSCTSLTQYSGMAEIRSYDSVSRAVEEFFAARDRHDRITQKAAGTVKVINNNIERCEKKIAIHRGTLEKSQKRDIYKIYGDLLTANLYRIEGGASDITVQNYYSADGGEITIPLKPELSPSGNAQRYYKLYNKAKASEEHAAEQLAAAETEKAYLETVLDSVTRAQSYTDVAEIRDELADGGYITRNTSKKKKFQKKSQPMEFISSDGYTILIGRNNKQNDELTIKMSYSTDIWMHTKNIPGSHTLIRTNGQSENDIPDRTIVEAAELAAYFSKARSGTGIAVDYTQVKNIRKPNGSKPGFVIYEANYTVYVTPDESLVERLMKK